MSSNDCVTRQSVQFLAEIDIITPHPVESVWLKLQFHLQFAVGEVESLSSIYRWCLSKFVSEPITSIMHKLRGPVDIILVRSHTAVMGLLWAFLFCPYHSRERRFSFQF